MTLRDWFAGQALSGYCANESAYTRYLKPEEIALDCWNLADAMIAEREKKQ